MLELYGKRGGYFGKHQDRTEANSSTRFILQAPANLDVHKKKNLDIFMEAPV